MYLDDSWQMALTYEECEYVTALVYNTMVYCGFLPHPVKSILQPTQVIETLGFMINSITMTVTISPTKMKHTRDLCLALLKVKSCTIRHLCKVIGKLIAVFPACPLGKLHYRNIERCKLRALIKNQWNYDATCTVDFNNCVGGLTRFLKLLHQLGEKIQQ